MDAGFQGDDDEFTWSDYVGFPVYSADNVQLGRLDSLIQDDRAAETVLIITPVTEGRAAYQIPASAVGIITRTRLMIDVTSERLERFESEQFPPGS